MPVYEQKDIPIICCIEMVKAIQDGSKTQTRRILTKYNSHGKPETGMYQHVPYDYSQWQTIYRIYPKWEVGDRLWVRETHYRYGRWIKNGYTKSGRQAWRFFPTTNAVRFSDDTPLKVQKGKKYTGWYKRPSIFMPKWAARIWREITEVRVERLQEISLADIQAEGIYDNRASHNAPIQRDKFSILWDSINSKRGYGWDVNCWVWVLTFKRV